MASGGGASPVWELRPRVASARHGRAAPAPAWLGRIGPRPRRLRCGLPRGTTRRRRCQPAAQARVRLPGLDARACGGPRERLPGRARVRPGGRPRWRGCSASVARRLWPRRREARARRALGCGVPVPYAVATLARMAVRRGASEGPRRRGSGAPGGKQAGPPAALTSRRPRCVGALRCVAPARRATSGARAGSPGGHG